MSEHAAPDQSQIKQETGADLDLGSDFDRFVLENLQWQQSGALRPLGNLLQLFYLMLLQMDNWGATAAPPADDPRYTALTMLFDKLFGSAFAHPHMLITRGLSLLNFSAAPTLEEPALELGCENGLSTKLLFERQFAYGVDISPKWEHEIREGGMHAEFRVGSADAIPLPDGSVRSIVMNNVLYHVANRRRVFEEILRCLQPGGRAYFDDLSPFFFEDSNRPFITFLRDSGAPAFAHDYMRRRNTLYMTDRTINPYDLLASGDYSPFLQSLGFAGVTVQPFYSGFLLRLAYNFLDMGFIFGSGALSPQGPPYGRWAKERLAAQLLHDRARCADDGRGGYTFVVATKPA